MKVRVSKSTDLDALVDDLRGSGCVPAKVDEKTVEVIHPEARDAAEARTELTFFLRAWQSRHPEAFLEIC